MHAVPASGSGSCWPKWTTTTDAAAVCLLDMLLRMPDAQQHSTSGDQNAGDISGLTSVASCADSCIQHHPEGAASGAVRQKEPWNHQDGHRAEDAAASLPSPVSPQLLGAEKQQEAGLPVQTEMQNRQQLALCRGSNAPSLPEDAPDSLSADSIVHHASPRPSEAEDLGTDNLHDGHGSSTSVGCHDHALTSCQPGLRAEPMANDASVASQPADMSSHAEGALCKEATSRNPHMAHSPVAVGPSGKQTPIAPQPAGNKLTGSGSAGPHNPVQRSTSCPPPPEMVCRPQAAGHQGPAAGMATIGPMAAEPGFRAAEAGAWTSSSAEHRIVPVPGSGMIGKLKQDPHCTAAAGHSAEQPLAAAPEQDCASGSESGRAKAEPALYDAAAACALLQVPSPHAAEGKEGLAVASGQSGVATGPPVDVAAAARLQVQPPQGSDNKSLAKASGGSRVNAELLRLRSLFAAGSGNASGVKRAAVPGGSSQEARDLALAARLQQEECRRAVPRSPPAPQVMLTARIRVMSHDGQNLSHES